MISSISIVRPSSAEGGQVERRRELAKVVVLGEVHLIVGLAHRGDDPEQPVSILLGILAEGGSVKIAEPVLRLAPVTPLKVAGNAR